MNSVTVSHQFQLTIPKKVRERMRIKAGEKMHVIAYDNIITLIPVRSMQEARGSLKNIKTDILRDNTDRV